MKAIDLRGLVPAPVTPFTRDGAVDHAAIQRLGSWLGSFDGVKGLVVLGHAGEGTFLSTDEQTAVIQSFIKSVDGKIPVIAGITLEGTQVAAEEAKRAVKAGAAARSLPCDLRRKWLAADPVPISGRDQGDVQPRDAA